MDPVKQGTPPVDFWRVVGQRMRSRRAGPAPVPVARDRPWPLSSAQQRLWFIQSSEPDCTAYNLSFTWRITGPLNVPALTQALTSIIERHAILRTTYTVRTGHPLQQIGAPRPLETRLVDLTNLPESEREAEMVRRLRQEAGRPFDLAQGPMLRASVLRLDEGCFLWQLVLHHIAFDGGSLGILYRELETLYDAFSRGAAPQLAPLPFQYADFAVWEQDWLNGGSVTEQLAFWKGQLGGELPCSEVATDHPRPERLSYRGARIPFACPPAVLETAQGLRRQERTTPFVVLLAAFEALLARYTHQTDLLVGIPVSNRPSPHFDQTIGFFANTLPLRLAVPSDGTFPELVRRTRETVFNALGHQEVPLEKIIEAIHPRRQPGRRPLFQVVFAYQNLPGWGPRLPGLIVEPVFIQDGASKFDLSLSIENDGHRLAGVWEFNTDLYERATIARLARSFEQLLAQAGGTPPKNVADLPLLDADETRRLTREIAPGPRARGTFGCAVREFEWQAACHGEARALGTPTASLRYGELNILANRLAHYLRRQGVGLETRVGICLERSVDMIVAILAVLKAGGVYVPLDPGYPQARILHMINASQTELLITNRESRQVFADSDLRAARRNGSPARPAMVLLDLDEPAIQQEADSNPVTNASAVNLAYIIFTSGSTGEPKGVMVCRGNLAHSTGARLTQYPQPVGRLLFVSSFAFDSSVASIFWPLITGGELCLLPREVERDPAAINAFIQQRSITHLLCLPTFYQLLLEQAKPGQLHSLRTVIVGGEISPSELVARHYAQLPDTGLFNEYGPTEATVWSSVAPLEANRRDSGNMIGRPIPNTAIYLLDPQGHLVPQGVPGEIHIGGAGISRGYCGNAVLTAERFVPDGFAPTPGQRLYRTGDWGRFRCDGTLEFLGRLDHQVKIRGYRIELGEIESAVRRYPGVREVAVEPSTDAEGRSFLVAYVVPVADHPPKVGDLRSFLRHQLPDFMVPNAFVLMKALPLSPNGKVDRHALPHAECQVQERTSDYVSPRNALEIQLVGMWQKALGKQPIGVRDDFFELGGHSFVALRLVAEVEKRLGRRLPLATLLAAPTVERLATVLSQEGWKPGWSSLVPIKPGGNRRPFYCVHGIGGNVLEFYHLSRHLAPDQPLYGLQARGLDGQNQGQATVEEMGARYLREVRQFQPEGPYCLGGSSFGGMVAYEMAQQLRATGEAVALLALFDTNGPGYPQFLPTTTAFWRWWFYWRRRFELHWSNVRLADQSERAEYIREKSRRFRKRLQHWGRDLLQEFFLPRAIRQVRRSGEAAARGYVPQPYYGKLTLFRATEQPYGIYEDRTVGWGALAVGGLEIIDIPGHHGAIVREPRVRVLAEQLTVCLSPNGHARAAVTGGAPVR